VVRHGLSHGGETAGNRHERWERRDGSERRCKRPAIGADGRSKLRVLVVLRSSGTGVMIWHSLGTQDLHAACTRRRLGTLLVGRAAAQHSQLLLLLLGTTHGMYNSERVSPGRDVHSGLFLSSADLASFAARADAEPSRESFTHPSRCALGSIQPNLPQGLKDWGSECRGLGGELPETTSGSESRTKLRVCMH
jgi:hypothetical protein